VTVRSLHIRRPTHLVRRDVDAPMIRLSARLEVETRCLALPTSIGGRFQACYPMPLKRRPGIGARAAKTETPGCRARSRNAIGATRRVAAGRLSSLAIRTPSVYCPNSMLGNNAEGGKAVGQKLPVKTNMAN
jgi:hypothetical protein